MDVFDFDDYKVALRQLLETNRQQFGGRFTFEKMAKACGIQKTYLSRVINGKGHLSSDQLFSACEFLGLRDFEIEFIEMLRDRQNSQNTKRIAIIRKKIEGIRTSRLKSENVLRAKTTFTLEHAVDYYSNFNLHLTHLFLTVPRFSSSPEEICGVMGISRSELSDHLAKLKRWGLIKQKGDILLTEEINQHLPEDSPVFGTFATLQRIKAIEKMNRGKSKEDYFFSVLFSTESRFQATLRKKLLALLEESRAHIEKSKMEDVFQLNIDLFKWT